MHLTGQAPGGSLVGKPGLVGKLGTWTPEVRVLGEPRGGAMSEQSVSRVSRQRASDRAAAGLAYFTAIPAVILLLIEPYRRRPYIRFHAWQAIYFTVACLLIAVALFVVTESVPFLSFLEFDHFPLVSLLLVIVWVVVLLKAVNGESLRLPVIGALAEKRARPPQG